MTGAGGDVPAIVVLPGVTTGAAIAEKLHISLSTVEKNLDTIFDELDLARTTGYNRGVLAVLRHLES